MEQCLRMLPPPPPPPPPTLLPLSPLLPHRATQPYEPGLFVTVNLSEGYSLVNCLRIVRWVLPELAVYTRTAQPARFPGEHTSHLLLARNHSAPCITGVLVLDLT